MTEKIAESILVVDDERSMRQVVSLILSNKGYMVREAANGEEALDVLERDPVQLVICDIRMPGMDGIETLQAVRSRYPRVQVIMMTAFGSFETVAEAVKAGAYDYCSKPIRADELMFTVEKAMEKIRLQVRLDHLSAEKNAQYRFHDMVGKSSTMQDVFRTIRKVADTSSTVLITGESGTGKELIARALHYHSVRRNREFLALNCAAIPQDLLESELFGYRKGSFTGAVSDKRGLFEVVGKGTLLLDEVGEIPLNSQAKLLRVLQEGEFRPIGAHSARPIAARLIAATERRLEEAVDQGLFSRGLYYRLNVVNIHIPPLRERKEDIPVLIDFLLGRLNERYDKHFIRVSPPVLEAILQYDWPGNIRQLDNLLERSVLLSETDDEISLDHFPLKPGSGDRDRLQVSIPVNWMSLNKVEKSVMERVERELIRRALLAAQGNRTQAARFLEISRRALLYKMKRYDIS